MAVEMGIRLFFIVAFISFVGGIVFFSKSEET